MKLRLLIPAVFATSAFASLLAAAPQEAIRDLRKRAESRDPEAMYQLARLYETGYDSIAADSVRSMQLYKKAADAGYPKAQNYYGFLLYQGRGVERDRAKGLHLMEQAAMAGDPTAANNLGFLMLDTEGIEPNYENAAFWLRRAADSGMPQAQSSLADLYREGKGVPVDTLRAVELYDKAISKGLVDAQIKLLDMMEREWSGLNAEESLKLGLKYYTHGGETIGVILFGQAAEEGNAKALALLGDAFTRARGADYDHDRALQCYALAAEKGDPSAQFILSELLEIFPDALDALDPVIGAETIPACHRNARYYREQAENGGVLNAEQAQKRLLSTE